LRRQLSRSSRQRAPLAILVAVVGAVVAAACGPAPAQVEPQAVLPVTAGARAVRITAPTGDTPGPGTTLAGCSVFPPDNPWNSDISKAPLRAGSAATIARLGGYLHPDFGGGGQYGIPYIVVPADEPPVPVTFTAYGAQSDPGPYPIPTNAPVEGGSDAHVLALQQGTCLLYEMFAAHPSGGGWAAGSGARFDLHSNALRPEGWTSADAAGLPILPGLVRYDEVASGQVTQAIRVTFSQTYAGYIHPATHQASSETDPALPPMGLRLRLNAGFDTSGFTGGARVILEAMKRYGLIVADNGSNWFFTGAADPRWDDENLNQLKRVPGSAFEVVDTGAVVTDG
jgi:hypothetical protein